MCKTVNSRNDFWRCTRKFRRTLFDISCFIFLMSTLLFWKFNSLNYCLSYIFVYFSSICFTLQIRNSVTTITFPCYSHQQHCFLSRLVSLNYSHLQLSFRIKTEQTIPQNFSTYILRYDFFLFISHLIIYIHLTYIAKKQRATCR